MDFDLKIELREIPIELLEENRGQIPEVPRNPRKITREAFKKLVDSIQQSPEIKRLDKVKVYPYEGKYVVLSGNHRLRAYRQLQWKTVWCKVIDESTPKVKLREYVIRENQHYAENDAKILGDWNPKELVGWDVDIILKGNGGSTMEDGEVEFTEILGEEHNYVVLYFDDEVDWLQAQTLLGVKPVRCLSTKYGEINMNGQKRCIGRVMKGKDVINRLLGENRLGSKKEKNNEDIG
jgi:hypothetical protein